MRVVGPSVMTVSCNSSMEISSHICEKINARVHLFDRPQDAGRGQDMTDVLDDRELTVSGMIRHHATVAPRSEEHTSELQSLMRISYAVFCLKKKTKRKDNKT